MLTIVLQLAQITLSKLSCLSRFQENDYSTYKLTDNEENESGDMCSRPPHTLVTGPSSVRDFKGGRQCFASCQEDLLKVCGRQRFCEGNGSPRGTQKIVLLHRCERHGRRANRSIMNALPTEAVSAAAAIVIVGASAGALMWMNQDKLPDVRQATEKCEACDGSGLCSACKGEGFQLKDLSAEAAQKARANARNAATRYTAGLAKKWSYCASCSGSRSCKACDGRGRLSTTQSGS